MAQDQTHPFKGILRHALDLRSRVFLGAFYSITNKIFDLAPPVLIGAAVDVVVSRQNSVVARLGVVELENQLWVLAAVTLGIWVCESIFEYLAGVCWRNLAQELQHRLRIDVYQHVQTLDMSYFETTSSGQLMAVVNDDINQLERFLDIGAHEILILLTTVLVIGGIFIGLVPDLAWMTIAPMPLIAYCSLKFQKIIAPRYSRVREQAGEINAQLVNNLQGIATIKSYTSEEYEVEQIRNASSDYRRKNSDAISLSSSFVPLIRMLVVVGFAAIMIFGGQKALQGELNVGAYSVLVFMTQRLLWPLTRLGSTMDLYYRALASARRVLSLLETRPTIADSPEISSSSLPKKKVEGQIAFVDVSFSYPSREQVLDKISFDVQAGSTVGIVGSTGSGKTTLIKLLLRFYEPTSGDILLDGTECRQLPLEYLRQAIALVSQDVFLVDGSVADNISYGSFSASESEIRSAAQFAEIDEFISSLPDGYNTRVGERGQKLSGGQRQRIAIARAILKDSPVLILDEATSSVDNETEAAIQRALYKLMGKKTILVIAHRLSTVRHADEIIVLDSGSLVERGTHDELLNLSGNYANLWRVQTGLRAIS